MPSAQAALALITANSIGISALTVLIRMSSLDDAESPAQKATVYKRAGFLIVVTGFLAASFGLSLLYLYAVEFGAIVGWVPLPVILALAAITLYIGAFGPIALLFFSKRRVYKRDYQETEELHEKMKEISEEFAQLESDINDTISESTEDSSGDDNPGSASR